MSAVVVAYDDTLDAVVKLTEVSVIDFWATWCGPCHAFTPVFEASALRHRDVTHVKVDVDSSPGLAAQFAIYSVPTTMFVREGVVVGRIAGAVTPKRLEDLLDQTRNLDMDVVRAKL